MKPEIVPVSFPESVEAGTPLQVTCLVTGGDEPLTLQWYKDNVPLHSTSDILINQLTSRASNVLISSADSHHTGLYTCQAFNPVASVEWKANLTIKGFPFIITLNL